ncbi:hypothetical protein SAMN05661091_4731 [Paenibacillus uliginis N3/975]|uniref:Uncharacterized protein n=1 Tax=Paenibacillus uliginis N3/975 TaxID=1313296 RepID=A0A1X7HMX0_9BACL|nr:hypothetical protein [Paenibacillus uliginis]SMF89654.1 hypothetical protein SAMN05661091_4731 [Paenibacillus uliginis N3/975]
MKKIDIGNISGAIISINRSKCKRLPTLMGTKEEVNFCSSRI